MKKTVSLFIMLLILSVILVSFPQIEEVKAEGSIYIRSDGSVVGTDEIFRDGNLYTFIDDLSEPLVVEKDGIIVNGAG